MLEVAMKGSERKVAEPCSVKAKFDICPNLAMSAAPQRPAMAKTLN